MANIELSTAKYFQESQPASDTRAPDVPLPDELETDPSFQPFSSSILAIANSYLTLIVAAGVILCVAMLAFPYLKSAWSNHPKSILDLWVQLGGGKSGQTFEQFIKERTDADQREWAEMYKNSPAYKFKDMPFTFDASKLNLQFNQPQRRK